MKTKLIEFLEDPVTYKQYSNIIREILTTFDFSKIHNTMKCLDWKWTKWYDEYGAVSFSEVPSEFALRKACDQIFSDFELYVKEHPDIKDYIHDGGGFLFKIEVLPYNEDDSFDKQISIRFDFVLESYTNQY